MSTKLFLIIAIAGSLLAFGGGFGGTHVMLTKQYESAVNAYMCSKNLKVYDQAVQSYASARGLGPGNLVGMGNLDEFLPNGRPACPAEGQYAVKETGMLTACSEEGHDHTAEKALFDKYPARAAEHRQ